MSCSSFVSKQSVAACADEVDLSVKDRQKSVFFKMISTINPDEMLFTIVRTLGHGDKNKTIDNCQLFLLNKLQIDEHKPL